MSEKTNLLREIVHCDNVEKCLFGQNEGHLCYSIVQSQGVVSLDNFQVPEPWNGNIVSAPILFLSSNPSISEIEDYPYWGWQDDLIEDFFTHRFGGGRKDWVRGGKYALRRDGSYLPATPFWSEVMNRATEILGRQANPGIDFAITEIVHCKSRSNIGVDNAIGECSNRYLLRVLGVSNSNILACIGKKVGSLVREAMRVKKDVRSIGPRVVADRERLVLFLNAPGSSEPRVLEKVFSHEEIGEIRSFVNNS